MSDVQRLIQEWLLKYHFDVESADNAFQSSKFYSKFRCGECDDGEVSIRDINKEVVELTHSIEQHFAERLKPYQKQWNQPSSPGGSG